MEDRSRKSSGTPDDRLARLLQQTGVRQRDLLRYSERLGEPAQIGRSFFSNLKRVEALPSKLGLKELSDFFSLTTDGAYRIYDVVLDDLAVAERLLNASRTRVVESYLFNRDLPLPYPKFLNPRASPARSAYFETIVEQWQKTTVRSFERELCGPPGCCYLQLGRDDDTASPAIPRGSLIQAAPIGAQEALRPEPHRYYVIQHGHGYLCTQCSIQDKFLIIHSSGSFYHGSSHLRLPEEALVMGKATACIVVLPLAPKGNSQSPRLGPPAPIIAPGQHLTIHEKFVTARLRYGMINREIDDAVEQIRPILGYGVTGKHVRLLEEGRSEPLTRTCLALTPVYSLRFQDVLKAHGIVLDDTERWSLDRRLATRSLPGPFTDFTRAEPPSPKTLWSGFFGQWHDLPMLLHHMRTSLNGRAYEFFYLNQSHVYHGLDPLLPAGSILAIEPIRRLLKELPHDSRRGWERPIFLLRIRNGWICSHIDIVGGMLTLVPHPDAQGVAPWTLPRDQVEVHGMVIGALFLPPEASV